jgi:hypothetical protein
MLEPVQGSRGFALYEKNEAEFNERRSRVMFELAEAIRRAWPVFREAARMKRTVSYTELAGRAGPPLHRRHIHRQLLQPLSARCRELGFPDLAALVVRKDTGLPGAGFFGAVPVADPEGSWAEALAECFAYPWPARPDPRLFDQSVSPDRNKPVDVT